MDLSTYVYNLKEDLKESYEISKTSYDYSRSEELEIEAKYELICEIYNELLKGGIIRELETKDIF